ncbi:hypothetical protein FQA47_022554 [Oryzias melastigma]|uniref:Uncharacterized protein n=1 Tax=Oryzias melastigma TaxID=30732 RepID=A0A834CEH8_ORYME|nr:hypothetical protein FQA47_022554 [Oryzias melastigma]
MQKPTEETLRASMDGPGCACSKALKQPAALSSCLHPKRALSNGCRRDAVKGKDATPASARKDSFKHGRFGGI